MQVIGAGFGRTGTASLKAALEHLGLRPCYHMLELFDHPEMIGRWLDIAEGRSADWDAVFDGYQATVDWPGASYWYELADHYPEAKILLSVRDPERWYRSINATIFKQVRMRESLPGRARLALLSRLSGDFAAFTRMTHEAVVERVFDGDVTDKAHVMKVFRNHIETVRSSFPPERVLVYDVLQGWAPLCAFLGLPVPAEPFPRLNDSETFGRETRRRMTRLILGGARRQH
ncbi:sulfotransferase family protein [Streptosporangium sp. NPDC000396]|uniref:sulfotransferase family protein n=1 Tax=Streptosporangium sp. NPDC000396 TaxID=3366185 RepID=UPI00369C8C4E